MYNKYWLLKIRVFVLDNVLFIFFKRNKSIKFIILELKIIKFLNKY